METSASSKPGPRHRSTRHLISATRCTAESARSAPVGFSPAKTILTTCRSGEVPL